MYVILFSELDLPGVDFHRIDNGCHKTSSQSLPPPFPAPPHPPLPDLVLKHGLVLHIPIRP